MCGLVGLAGDLSTNHKDAFKNLLIIDQVRGTHGTGVASIGSSGEVDWVKRHGGALDLFDSKTFDRVVTTFKRVLLGHNRYATLGGHTSDNAHPFDFKNIIGAHNGTIAFSNRRHLKFFDKYDTDSEAIYAEIDDNIRQGMPWEEAVKEVLGKIDDGAWALTFYVKSAKKLVFLRNKERTLFYCTADCGRILAWASEAWMLYSILQRHNIKIDGEEGIAKVSLLPEDTMLAFEVTKNAIDTFKPPERTTVKGAEKKNWSSFQNGGNQTTTRHTALTHHVSTNKVQPLFPNDNKRGHYKPPYKYANGDTMNKVQFEKQIEHGVVCCYCNNHTPTWGEEVLFLRPSPVGSPQFLCQECIKDDMIMDISKAMR